MMMMLHLMVWAFDGLTLSFQTTIAPSIFKIPHPIADRNVAKIGASTQNIEVSGCLQKSRELWK